MIHLLKYGIRWAYEISNDKIVGQRHKLKILSILPVFMAEVLYEEKYISIKSSCYLIMAKRIGFLNMMASGGHIKPMGFEIIKTLQGLICHQSELEGKKYT